MKKVYASETGGLVGRGRPVKRWKNRVKEYRNERVADRGGGVELTRRECGEVEALLLWPSPWGTSLEGTRHQDYR